MEETKDMKNQETSAQAAEKETEKTEKPNKTEKTKKSKQNKQVAELESKLGELNDQMLRTLAEYDNYRKRTQKEKESMYADGIVYAVKAFLPLIDNLGRAVTAAEEDSPLKEGVAMIVKQTEDILKNIGITEFGEAGDAFDPNMHAAVMHIEDENLPENSVAEVLQKGYVYKDGQVVRHAAVKVAN